jgi:mannitol-1-phosphate/altronate dehydrogenase
MASFSPASGSSALALADATLGSHRDRLPVPTYDRASLRPGIVHLGVGGFHRAHQAVYLDDLAEQRVTLDWGIVGVGLRRPDMKEALEPQDRLFTVVERGARRDAARVVGAMSAYVHGPEDPAGVLRALTDERTRLVMLTVTGDGYHVDPATGGFDGDSPAVQADLRSPARPRTPPAYLVEALARRRAAGIRPFTVLSCDNIPGNGRVARTALVSYARQRDEVLARWIDREVAFPSSMVDRITPKTTAADRALLQQNFGIDDRWPVVAEPFAQWILEDDFCNERPPLDAVGAQFVADVAPYQLMKNRLLNAGHSAIGYLGALAGHSRTDEAVADPALAAYLSELMAREVGPLLQPVPGVDLRDYQRTLLRRFANPKIGDPLARLCARGSTKMPAYLLPSIADASRRGQPHPLLTLAVAAWFRYLRGSDCDGRPIEVKDALADELRALARAGGTDPRPLLSRRAIFGELLDDAAFVHDLEQALLDIEECGVRAAVGARLPAALAGAA